MCRCRAGGPAALASLPSLLTVQPHPPLRPYCPLPGPQFEAAFPDKSAALVVGCLSGKRSLAACDILSGAGYTSLKNVEGGYQGACCAAWRVAVAGTVITCM